MHRERPAQLDLDHYRKQAKRLVKAYRAADTGAFDRVGAVFGGHPRERFLLSDAQHVIAREHGHRTWAELRRFVDSMEPEPSVSSDGSDGRLNAFRRRLELQLERVADRGDVVVETDQVFAGGEPVRVLVRKRGRRYDISDDGDGVRLAGRTAGWLDVAEHLLADEGLNVNRRGVIFVPAVEGRDLASLALRIADASLAVHSAVLELGA